jgi:hypothetical protein
MHKTLFVHLITPTTISSRSKVRNNIKPHLPTLPYRQVGRHEITSNNKQIPRTETQENGEEIYNLDAKVFVIHGACPE